MDKLQKPLYQPLFDAVNSGVGVLTAGKIHESIPTIHDVGHKLPTDAPVKHAGFGLFMATVGDSDVNFDGGDAMTRAGEGDTTFSWTRLYASREQLDAMGYPMEEVRDALVELMEDTDNAENS